MHYLWILIVLGKQGIRKYSKDFDGTLSDGECIKLIGISRNTYDKTHELLVVMHAYTESGNIKNGDKGVKTIPLSKEASMLLDRYRTERPDSKYIFPNAAGNRIMGGQSDIRTTQRYLSRNITQKDFDTVNKAFDYGLSTNFNQDLSKEKTS